MAIFIRLVIGYCVALNLANAQTMLLSTSNADYQMTKVFSDVGVFAVDIEIDAPMVPGIYLNPDLIDVTYRVMGNLEPGTPSGFLSFDLQRTMTGAEFYAQGRSLSFEISPTAVLSDGIQVAELVGSGVVFTFNAREIDTGRFHPAILELSDDGSGRLQNSNNMPSQVPPVSVNFGEEYITDLMFDAGNTTIITERKPPPVDNDRNGAYIECFIATAAYGTYFEPEVKVLRKFRDTWLLPYSAGRSFVDWYYKISPPIANVIAQHEWLRALTRGALMPVVYSIQYPVAAMFVLFFLMMYIAIRFCRSGKSDS